MRDLIPAMSFSPVAKTGRSRSDRFFDRKGPGEAGKSVPNRRARHARAVRTAFLFIANPCARNGRARHKLVQLRRELDHRGISYDLAVCDGLDHAGALSAEANRAGYDVVVGVGGDGTINRVLNGFFDANGRRLSAARMGAIHIGTSPDFCRSYGVPTDVHTAVEALLAGVSKKISVGKIVCESRSPQIAPNIPRAAFFGCCANIGLGASLARLANGGIRRYAGDSLGTFLCLLRVLARQGPRAMTLEIDGRAQQLESVYNIAVGKTRYIASGIQVRHDLSEADNRFYIITLRNLAWHRLGSVLWTLYSGRPITSGKCLSLTYGSNIRIDSPGASTEVEFDGDPAGWCPCRIETAPDALDLIVGGAL